MMARYLLDSSFLIDHLRGVGFNRISFGMQSAVPHVLATLDRTHDPLRVPAAVGWAAVGNSIEPDTTLIGNFFTGTVAKFSLKTGEIVAKAESGVQRSLAGLAQYPG